MCTHQPQCPPIDQPGWDTASVLIHHAELGWSMLCNGAIVLDSVAERSLAPVVPLRRVTPVQQLAA